MRLEKVTDLVCWWAGSRLEISSFTLRYMGRKTSGFRHYTWDGQRRGQSAAYHRRHQLSSAPWVLDQAQPKWISLVGLMYSDTLEVHECLCRSQVFFGWICLPSWTARSQVVIVVTTSALVGSACEMEISCLPEQGSWGSKDNDGGYEANQRCRMTYEMLWLPVTSSNVYSIVDQLVALKDAQDLPGGCPLFDSAILKD